MAGLDCVLDKLAVGARPTSQHDWERLRKEVTLIIDLNDDPLERKEAERLGIQYRGLKVEDPPRGPESLLEIFWKARDLINKELERGSHVYLHCTAGQQRSPTCAMAYLIAIGENKETAIKKVMAARFGVWPGPVDVRLWQVALDMWDRELKAKKQDW